MTLPAVHGTVNPVTQMLACVEFLMSKDTTEEIAELLTVLGALLGMQRSLGLLGGLGRKRIEGSSGYRGNC